MTARGRQGAARARRAVAATTALTVALAGALVATGLTVASAPEAVAAPGTPGVPQDPVLIFTEDYENAGDGSNVLLPDYVGLQSTYSADPPWADRPNCNGFVIDATSPQLPEDCSNAPTQPGSTETPDISFDHLQGMTTALGELAGDPSPETNSALASYTANQEPIASQLVFGESLTELDVPAGRQIVLRADLAAMNCAASAAVLTFVLVDGDGNEYPIRDASGSQTFQPCSYPQTQVTTPDGEDITVHVGTFVSTTFRTGIDVPAGSYRILGRNGVGAGQGNDFALDNVWAQDVTNQLDKGFDPAVAPVGSTSTLTFTITNTSELGSKPAYSFTDTLPAGLVVANPPNATDTCNQFFWGPQPGATTLTVNGPAFPEGFESCTITVDVTSDTAAVYTNGPDDITDLTGLAAPADATVEFTDDAPEAGLTITKEADVASAAPGDTVSYTVTVENSGQVDYTDADPATFSDDLSGVLDDATFVEGSADADTGTVDATGLPTLAWSGPLDVGDTATITYSVTVADPPPGDGILTNAVTGPDESNCVDGSEAGCATSTPVRGLTITKSATPDDALVPGEDVAYTITVENSGQFDYTDTDPATFTDDMSELLDNVTYNGDATADVGTVDDSALPLLTWSGPLPVGGTATITYTVTAGPEGTGDGVPVNRVTGPPESNCLDGTEDGCFVDIPPRGLDIEKTADASVVEPGGTVTYEVSVTNTGAVPYTAAAPATFADDLTAVLDDATYDGNASADIGVVDDTALPALSWSGALAPGETATITYSVTVLDPAQGDGLLTNAVTGPAESSCVEGTEDGCTVETRVRSLSITKESAPADVAPGGQVEYTVTVENTGQAPYTILDPASFDDDLTGVLDDATYDGNATADVGTVDDSALPALSWSGALAPGEAATITYSVTVDDPVDGDHLLTNAVVGPAESSCADGTEPGCTTTTPVRELTILKTATPDEALIPGEDITYTIVVTNSGEVAYTVDAPAEVADDLTDVLDDATYNDDATADVGTVDDSGLPQITWSGPLAVGETATITFSVTVDDPVTGDGVAVNTVTGPPESNCVDGTEDGCSVTTPPKAVEITKTADVDEVLPGGTVTYTITVENTGEIPYTDLEPAVISDDLAGVVDDATYAGDATADVGTVDDSALPTLTWSGALAPGDVATITYSVTVNDPLTGDGVLENAVTGPVEGSCAADGGSEGCSTSTPVRALEIIKTVDVDSAVPGDVVTYTVTVENIGQAEYAFPVWAEFTDDLSGVLDDATYNGDAAATSGATLFADPTLQWRGVLAAGESATITYSVTVDDPLGGDGILTNAVTGPDESGCTAAEPCTTDTPVRGLTIVKSATPDDVLVPGEDITYTITVVNSGQYAYTDADPATLTDDMTDLVDDATFNDDASADVGTVDGSGAPTLTWSGPLAVGETATITYTVTVGPVGSGDGTAVNRVTGPPESSCLDGTEDGCFVVIPPSGLDITKTADASVVEPGDTLTYQVTVTNTGEAAYTEDSPATFSDDLTGVLDDATFDGASTDVGSVDLTALPTLSWSGALAPGETATITYEVTVGDPPGGDGVLENVVTGPAESSCAEGVEPDDPDGCSTTTPVRSLDVAKSADVTSVTPGGTVTYTITVENAGSAPYTILDPATVTDDATGVADDATYDGNASADLGTVDDTGFPTLTWSGALAVGATATITYSVTVDDPPGGDGVLDNVVTGGVSCVDGSEEGCSTTTPVRMLDVAKSVDAAQALPGDTLTYTIVVTNSGQVDYGPDDPAVVVDDLSAVLADATYDGDATATSGTVDDSAPPTLTWTGELAAGEAATITFSVTVDDALDVETTLVNVVTGPAESSCPVDMGDGGADGAAAAVVLAAVDPACSAETLVAPPGPTPEPTPEPSPEPSPDPTPTSSPEPSASPGATPTPDPTPTPTPDTDPLPRTGADIAVAVVLAVLLLVTGVFMVSVVRRLKK